MSGFASRENQLFEALRTLTDEGFDYLVVGGYAVSATRHRFSTDVDIVVISSDVESISAILRAEGYEKIEDAEFDYGRFVSFEKDAELPVTVDLMVESVQSRQTDAVWSYTELKESAERATIQGQEESVTVRVPDPAALVAMKLHSGRLTDVRDVVALADEVDFDTVEDFLYRGDTVQLREVLKSALTEIRRPTFPDAFKGVFAERELPVQTIERLETWLEEQVAKLEND